MKLFQGIGNFLSGVSPMASSLIGAWTGSQQNEKQRQSSMELAKYQYSRDLEMWNRANQYNSPQEQMKRLEAAGLNPNLVYGSGATATSSSQLPKFNAPNLQFGIPNPAEGLPGTIATFQDFQIKQQQLDNLKAQEDAIKQNTINRSLGAQKIGQDIQRFDLTWEPKMIQEWEKAWTLEQKRKQGGELFPSQLTLMQGKNRAQQIEAEKNLAATAKIKQDTEMQKLKTDWYVTSLIGRFGLDVAKTIIGATGVGKLGKLIPGQIRTNRKPSTPRYNSTESWRQLGY